MKAGRQSKAFTLVELLVVIAIIALLMAILAPVLHRARGKAHQISCMNTMRNLSFGYKLYLHETEKYLPISTGSFDTLTPWYNNNLFRRGLGLKPVSEEDKVWRRDNLQRWKPNVPKKYICAAATYALKHPEDGLYPIDRSFGVNIEGDYWAWRLAIGNWRDKERWVKNPSQKLFMADALDWWIAYRCSKRYFESGENWIGHQSEDESTYGMTAYRHFGRADIMYWDGHCGQLTSDEIAYAPDPNDLWNPLH